jgi:hypothetical protein
MVQNKRAECRSYKSYEEVEPGLFKGDLECFYFATGEFRGVERACAKRRGKFHGKVCPWGGRPDKGGNF